MSHGDGTIDVDRGNVCVLLHTDPCEIYAIAINVMRNMHTIIAGIMIRHLASPPRRYRASVFHEPNEVRMSPTAYSRSLD